MFIKKMVMRMLTRSTDPSYPVFFKSLRQRRQGSNRKQSLNVRPCLFVVCFVLVLSTVMALGYFRSICGLDNFSSKIWSSQSILALIWLPNGAVSTYDMRLAPWTCFQFSRIWLIVFDTSHNLIWSEVRHFMLCKITKSSLHYMTSNDCGSAWNCLFVLAAEDQMEFMKTCRFM